MSRKIRISFQDGYSLIQIEDDSGVTREVNAPSMVAVLANLNGDDHDMIMRFCQAMFECGRNNSPQRLANW